MNKIKFLIKILFALILFVGLVSVAHAQYDYKPLENIPGSEGVADFPGFIMGLYKFVIWTVGIAALLMITIGGFLYLTSEASGNTSKLATAKKLVVDALIGLFIALAAYLVLFVINPDLVNIKINFQPINLRSGTGTTGTTGTTTPGTGGASSTGGKISGGGTGKCEVLPASNPCGTQNLSQSCSTFSSNASQMSQICNRESDGGNPIKASGTDLCIDGNSWSIGLFQINMINSAGSAGCNGSDIFETAAAGNLMDCAAPKVTNSKGLTYCPRRNCKVKNQDAYNKCKTKLQNPQTNIQAACGLYQTGGYGRWENSAKICGIN
ncbi:MAG: pilin [bacterium]|nr:pilin [bacterium]